MNPLCLLIGALVIVAIDGAWRPLNLAQVTAAVMLTVAASLYF